MRLIDADKLEITKLAEFKDLDGDTVPVYGVMAEDIDNAPTVDAIVLPVKVGQTVWALEKYGGKHIAIIEGKAQMVGVTSRSVKVLLRNHKDFNKTFVFGKTVFLTREAAEEALKARENNAD
jgi:hypothetical protein